MAISISLNGVVYTIPETGDESWGEILTSYFVAIPQGVLQKVGGAFSLSADVNFGANYGLLSKYFSTRSANPSTAGLVRLALADTIGWRNNANDGNLLLSVDASDQLTFNGGTVLPGGMTGLSGDVTATGPGVAVATIAAGAITDAKVSASAAIAYSKLALTGAILNADISASAAIAATKIANGSVSNAQFERLGATTFALVDTTTPQTVANKNLVTGTTITTADLNFTLTDAIDTTKRFQFSASGISPTLTRILTIPNANTTLVGTGVTQTLTNKTIDGTSNTLSNISNSAISASAAIDATKIANGSVSSTEFQYLDGVTSSIQAQINAITAGGVTSLTGDVTGTGPGATATAVDFVGGVTAANVASGATLANDATELNTASAIVKRDGAGDFSAGTVTAGELNSIAALTIKSRDNAGSESGILLLHTGQSIDANSGNTLLSTGSSATLSSGSTSVLTGDSSATSGLISIKSGSSSTANTGNVNISTGDTFAGDSGNIILSTGMSGATKGRVLVNDGGGTSPVLTEAQSATVTSKSIDGDNNTITNIGMGAIKPFPKFRVTVGSPTAPVPTDGTLATCVFDTTVNDSVFTSNPNFNTMTGVFTVPGSGPQVWQLNTSISIGLGTSGSPRDILDIASFAVNGVKRNSNVLRVTVDGDNITTVGLSDCLDVAGGDTIELKLLVYIFGDTGNTWNLFSSGDVLPFFSGYQVP